MKNIFRIPILSFILVALGSCTNDKDPVATASVFELRKDALVVPPTVFSETNKTETFAKLDWDRSGNGGVASSATYSIYVTDHDADPNFQNGVESTVGLDLAPDARKATITVDNLNLMMNQLPTFKCGPMNIDVRIKSKLGIASNALYQYSTPIAYTITGYPKAPFIMALVTEGGNADDAPKIVSSSFTSNTDYEGYMYLEPGNYKLYQPDACGDFTSATVYGLSAGTLVAGGTDSYVVAAAGHYLVKANLSNNTYSIAPFTTFGIFGAARGIPLAQIAPMTYDPAGKKWTLTYDLFKGRKFKFKAVNGATTVSVLGVSSGSSLIEYPSTSTSGDIRVPGTDDNSKQSYTIILDTSNPKAYTYTLTAN